MAGAARTLLKSPQFKRAFAQRLAVLVEADGQLDGRFILRRDDLGERGVMFIAQFLVIGNHGLQLAHEPIDHHAAADEQQAERGQKQPAKIGRASCRERV